MYKDIRQSPEYGLYMEKIGWTAIERKIKNTKCRIYIRRLPFLGLFIKILRPTYSPLEQLDLLAKKYHAFAVQINYSPTKTLRLDLTLSLAQIQSQMKKDCRYEIRKALKNKIIVKKSEDIESFIKMWHKNALRRGFWIPFGKEIRSLYESFGPNAFLLLAYPSSSNFQLPASNFSLLTSNFPISGALILFSDHIAYYFHAASTPEGRKLSAPYLVVWEAIKLSKKRGCQTFDFEGIQDPRDKNTRRWGGFTHFKKSFGGKEIEYPIPLTRFSNPLLRFASRLHVLT